MKIKVNGSKWKGIEISGSYQNGEVRKIVERTFVAKV